MLDNILKIVTEQVVPAITNNADIPDNQKENAVQATTSGILEGLKDHFIPDNLSDVANLFGGGAASSFGGSSMIQGIQSTVASALTQKVGLNGAVATTIASTVVPAVIGMFSNKVNDQNDSGFNVESLIKAFTGGGGNQGGGGILGMLGGLLGGK